MHLLVSIMLICCGFLVQKYPDIIDGYNSIQKKEVAKDKVDINSLSLFLKRLLTDLGLLTYLIALMFNYFDVNKIITIKVNLFLILSIILTGIIYSNQKSKL